MPARWRKLRGAADVRIITAWLGRWRRLRRQRLITLPLLLRYGVRYFAGLGWRRALISSLLGGAPFALLQTGGYGFVPLAHGAVITPSTVTAPPCSCTNGLAATTWSAPLSAQR
ncbi:hypothetical protein RSO01_24880 [Reyranella soli]|uniref:Uncharacterized protein n=1 Tax=Reyranella soli TaxID=1230389 RepID=A0A512N8L6_9HYPH|nr:hypothetical protein RSO01_24880 [Reyranella soli]